jgi:hypothetical protein
MADCTIDGVARERKCRDGKVADLSLLRQRFLERGVLLRMLDRPAEALADGCSL